MAVANVYRLYTQEAEKKGRTRDEVGEIIRWLTGHTQPSLDAEPTARTSFDPSSLWPQP